MIDVIFSIMLAIASAFPAASSAAAWCESRQLYDLCVSLVWTGATCYWLLRMVVELYPYVKYMNARHSRGWKGMR